MVSTVGVTLGTVGAVVGGLALLYSAAIAIEVDMKVSFLSCLHATEMLTHPSLQCEKPKYTLIRALGKKKRWNLKAASELRSYSEYLVAEVTLSNVSDMKEALSSGFRQIAGFIFGKNVAPTGVGNEKVAMTSPVTLESTQEPQSAKIAMTSPVAAEKSAEGAYKVSFIMPSKYTLETLPKPLNENVKIYQVPARTMAALTWNGPSPREQKMAQKLSELKEILKAEGLEVANDKSHLWQYHPPFAFPFQRVNEVLLEVNVNAAAQ